MRKITQLIEVPDTDCRQGWLTALCDDGTVWYYQNSSWSILKEQIPQGEIDAYAR